MQNDNPIRNKHHKVPHVMSVCCTGGILEGRIALRFAFKVELLKMKKKKKDSELIKGKKINK